MTVLQEKLTAGASLTAVTVLATMWFLRDRVIAGVKMPGRAKRHVQRSISNTQERLRLWSLKRRGVEDYVGRHRLELMPA